MLKTEEGDDIMEITALGQAVAKNYTIQKDDYLSIEVYANNGERIIDPNLELNKDLGTTAGTSTPELQYLVTEDGSVKFPQLGPIKLEGYTLREAEALLEKEYSKYYKDPFVKLAYQNKRAIILGSPGGYVVPLQNENMDILEVLALAEGIDNNGKVQNIRLIRDGKVFLIDLSTVKGYLSTNMTVMPDDIIYIEPVRRPFSEGLREYAPFVSILTSLAVLIVVISNN
ncbi:MAG: polysaccharide biosynthesis/export family protein [Bacteroidota bacterium]